MEQAEFLLWLACPFLKELLFDVWLEACYGLAGVLIQPFRLAVCVRAAVSRICPICTYVIAPEHSPFAMPLLRRHYTCP